MLAIPRLEIRPGEKVLLVGPNGAGKTSLLHILAGYMAPDQGEVTLPPRIVALTSPVDLPPLPVQDLVTDPALLEAFDLKPLREHLPERLSAGQRQKVAIGVALSQEADLYLFDEPLANLDESSRERVLEALFTRTQGKTLILVLHDPSGLLPRLSLRPPPPLEQRRRGPFLPRGGLLDLDEPSRAVRPSGQ